MLPTAVFWPMIAHAFLVFCVYAIVRLRRGQAVKAGEARAADFRDRQTDEPPTSRTAINNLGNQFELPVLFHVVCLSLFVTNGVSYPVVALAWIFTLSRYVHAAIHLGPNRLRHRFPAFVVGFVAVVLLWAWLALHLAGLV